MPVNIDGRQAIEALVGWHKEKYRSLALTRPHNYKSSSSSLRVFARLCGSSGVRFSSVFFFPKIKLIKNTGRKRINFRMNPTTPSIIHSTKTLNPQNTTNPSPYKTEVPQLRPSSRWNYVIPTPTTGAKQISGRYKPGIQSQVSLIKFFIGP